MPAKTTRQYLKNTVVYLTQEPPSEREVLTVQNPRTARLDEFPKAQAHLLLPQQHTSEF